MRALLLSLLSVVVCQPGVPSTAVLPFFNLSGQTSLDWIGESAAETVRRVLENEGLWTVDRESRQQAYRRLGLKPSGPLALGSVFKLTRELEASRSVYGSFRVSPGASKSSGSETIRLEARVLDLEELKLHSPVAVSGQLHDLSELQNRLAWLLLRQLLPAGTGLSEEKFFEKYRAVRLDALESYVRGLLATDPQQKHRLLAQAARLDENFTEPYFELGRLLYQGRNFSAAAGWLERVPAGSPDSLEALFMLGVCRYELAQYDKAEIAFRTLSDLLPIPEVLNNLGATLVRLGRPEAVDYLRRAVQQAPEVPAYRFNLGYALWRQQRYAEAADVFRALLDITPDDQEAILMLGRCLKQATPTSLAMKMESLERLQLVEDRTIFRRRFSHPTAGQ